MIKSFKLDLPSSDQIEVISSETDLLDKNSRLDEFYTQYKIAFPEITSERKDDLLRRLNADAIPNNYIVLYTRDGAVIGGLIMECYPCGYALLTYVFVLKEFDGQLIGTRLIDYLKRYIDTAINRSGRLDKRKIVILVFEAKIDAVYNNVHYSSIFEFYFRQNKLECQLINLYYIEPMSGSDDYLLGVIPTASSGNIRETLAISSYHTFLKELYYSADPENASRYLAAVKNRIDDRVENIPIVEFPKLRSPVLKIPKVSVALHIIEEDPDDISLLKENYYCKIFNSYEKDLFSQRYVQRSPYFSKHIDSQQVTIEFDGIVHFTSEGREETFIFVDEQGRVLSEEARQKNARVFINHTYFESEKKLIWTFVFHPESYFNEFEVIQLEKYFTGSQENVGVDANRNLDLTIKFLYQGRKYYDALSLANAILADLRSKSKTAGRADRSQGKLGAILAGAVQLDSSEIGFSRDPKHRVRLVERERHADSSSPQDDQWRFIYQYYNSDESTRKNDQGVDKLNELYDNNSYFEYALNSFCGIALGIFDFERMSFEEVGDTLVPLASTDTYFLILNKSSISCFCHENKLYANSIKYGIGINPYIIIPNAVLAYNSFWIDHGEKYLVEENPPELTGWRRLWILNRFFDKRNKVIFGHQLRHEVAEISKALHAELLNVFQYETEISIYNAGMEKRGINEKRTELVRHKNKKEDVLKEMEMRRTNSLGILSIILSVISLTQIYQFAAEARKAWILGFDPPESLRKGLENDPRIYIPSLSISIIFFFVFAYLIYRFYNAAEKVKSRSRDSRVG
ncbi:hypothetical protein SAMN04487996_101266 [Dyadobacter soli]|uniref:N-acetyltransferase domain-containing protein n=1 Tax=Dyadobacter soli TaxID=659014 RepID=A0A1G6VLW1_9BACT|nr:GNAT family N-acetyltransferase [Dyadobacter soli]SDD53875.1 hypothetical protein SAMN04487996_101266 [Dyadobacter soli]